MRPSNRGDRIRTCDLNVPNVARYQLRYAPMEDFTTRRRTFRQRGPPGAKLLYHTHFIVRRTFSAKKVTEKRRFEQERRPLICMIQ